MHLLTVFPFYTIPQEHFDLPRRIDREDLRQKRNRIRS